MISFSYRYCGLFFILLLGLSAIFCEQKKPVLKRQGDKIFFLSNRDAPRREFNIFMMNLDGTGQFNLSGETEGIRSFSKPSVSFSGETILFVTASEGQKTLQSIHLSGTLLVPLTQVALDNPRAQFSPDGKLIIFMDIIEGRHQIFVMNQDGSGRRNLSDNSFDEKDPSISPDGQYLCFTTKVDNKYAVAIMNLDGSEREILTDNAGNESNPSFSPDGSKIVFCSDRLGNSDIFYFDLAEEEMIEIFTKRSHDFDPRFSPDGKSILFISNVKGIRYRHLLLADLESKEIKNLTPDLNNFNHNPVFTPDGKSILFESIRFEDSEIYKIDINGENMINLTNHPKWDLAPAI